MNEMKQGGGLYLENGAQSHDDAQFETRVNEITQKILDNSTERRQILTLEQFMDMVDAYPQFEEYFPDIQAYFYSINGTLAGVPVKGALLAGNCMLIRATTQKLADEIAEAGLTDTRHYAGEYAFMEYIGVDPFEAADRRNAGIVTEAGGRKAN